jgi:hypothetical protein
MERRRRGKESVVKPHVADKNTIYRDKCAYRRAKPRQNARTVRAERLGDGTSGFGQGLWTVD